MIDNKVTRNFISNIFITKNYILYQVKKKLYELTIADKLPSNYKNRWMQIEIKESILAIEQHSEQINLNITQILRHNIILGIL